MIFNDSCQGRFGLIDVVKGGHEPVVDFVEKAPVLFLVLVSMFLAIAFFFSKNVDFVTFFLIFRAVFDPCGLFRLDAVFQQTESGGEHRLLEVGRDVFGKSVVGQANAGGHLKRELTEFAQMLEVGTAACQHDAREKTVFVAGVIDLLLDGLENLLLYAAVDDLGQVVLVDLDGLLPVVSGYGDEVVLVALVHHAGAERDFEFLGHLLGNLAHFGDVVCDDIAAKGDHLGIDRAAVNVDDQVGGAATDVHQSDTASLLFLAQTGQPGSERLKDDLVERKLRLVAAQDNLLDFLLFAGDNLVDADDLVPEHAHDVGVFGGHVVDKIALGNHVDDLLAGGNGHLEHILLHFVDLILGDGAFVAVPIEMTGVFARLDVMARNAYIDILDVEVGVLLGKSLGAKDALHGAVDVPDFPEFHARGLADAVSCYENLSVLVAIANDGGNLGCANVQSDYQVVVIVGVLHKL